MKPRAFDGTTTEIYGNNREGLYFRFDDDNNMSYKNIRSII